MEKETRKIIWSKRAGNQLLKIFDYIAADSFQNAEKVIDSIEVQVSLLSQNPERYPADKYKKYNDGSYRAFTKYRYRIAYRVSEHSIKIIRIRHTSRKKAMY